MWNHKAIYYLILPCLNAKDAIQACIDEDKYAPTRIIAARLNMSHRSVCDHLAAMGKKWLKTRWL